MESSGPAPTPNYNCDMHSMGSSSRQAADANAARPMGDGGVGLSSSSFDETQPFPPPLRRVPPPLRRGVRSTRTERGLSGPGPSGLSLEQLTEASLARAQLSNADMQELSPASETPVQAAALVRAASSEVALGRLHWRGRELSPEFHEYAQRICRGENLAPFRGQLLADESLGLPWESADSRPLRSKGPRVVGLLLTALALVAVVSGSLTSHEVSSSWRVPTAAALAATLPEPELTIADPVSSMLSPSPPAVEVTEVVSPPLPVPQRQPRKTAPPPPAAAEAKSPSPLLVEDPPF